MELILNAIVIRKLATGVVIYNSRRCYCPNEWNRSEKMKKNCWQFGRLVNEEWRWCQHWRGGRLSSGSSLLEPWRHGGWRWQRRFLPSFFHSIVSLRLVERCQCQSHWPTPPTPPYTPYTPYTACTWLLLLFGIVAFLILSAGFSFIWQRCRVHIWWIEMISVENEIAKWNKFGNVCHWIEQLWEEVGKPTVVYFDRTHLEFKSFIATF